MEKNLDKRLAEHPELRAKIEDMLDTIENAKGNVIKANDAEELIIRDMRQIGRHALTGWAQKREQTLSNLMNTKNGIVKDVKKI